MKKLILSIVLVIVLLLVVGGYILFFRTNPCDLPGRCPAEPSNNHNENFDTSNSITLTCENDGFCSYPQGKKIVKCIDTDGGENLYLKGKIYLYDENETLYLDPLLISSLKQYDSSLEPYVDFCLNDNELEEYTCNPRDIEDKYNCPNGCQNGACIK